MVLWDLCNFWIFWSHSTLINVSFTFDSITTAEFGWDLQPNAKLAMKFETTKQFINPFRIECFPVIFTQGTDLKNLSFVKNVNIQVAPTSFRQGSCKKSPNLTKGEITRQSLLTLLAKQWRPHFNLTNFWGKTFKTRSYLRLSFNWTVD